MKKKKKITPQGYNSIQDILEDLKMQFPNESELKGIGLTNEDIINGITKFFFTTLLHFEWFDKREFPYHIHPAIYSIRDVLADALAMEPWGIQHYSNDYIRCFIYYQLVGARLLGFERYPTTPMHITNLGITCLHIFNRYIIMTI